MDTRAGVHAMDTTTMNTYNPILPKLNKHYIHHWKLAIIWDVIALDIPDQITENPTSPTEAEGLSE